MKTQNQNEPQLSAEMEKQIEKVIERYYKKYGQMNQLVLYTADNNNAISSRNVQQELADFIEEELVTALEEQRAEILNEVESLLVDYFSTKAFSSTNPEVSINLKYAQNTIQKELRAKLAHMKGKE